MSTPETPIRLGLRENLAQFSLLVAVNALVGGMIGQERTVLPLLAVEEFHLSKFTATLTFIAAFGIVKAATNFFAGTLGTLILVLFAEPLTRAYTDAKFEDIPGKLALTVELTRVNLPFLTLIAIAAAYMGMLNAMRR